VEESISGVEGVVERDSSVENLTKLNMVSVVKEY
jgi:hypothetical protein